MIRKLLFLALALAFCLGLVVPTFAAGNVGDMVITDGLGREWKLSKPILGIKEINEPWHDSTVTAYVVSKDIHVTTPTLDVVIASRAYDSRGGFGGLIEYRYADDAYDWDILYDVSLVQRFGIAYGIVYIGDREDDEYKSGFYLYADANGGTSDPSPTNPAPSTPSVGITAKPTASTVLVNGTAKQFEVGYVASTKAITLTRGAAYTEAGGEMEGKGAGNKTPTTTTSKITLDGADVSFTAYNIDGNNYFKLRDIGAAFNFGVNWDGAKNTIAIDTSKEYTPE
jgi:hypothetical protein